MDTTKKKSFALGYSYIGLSFMLYLIFTIFASTGLSTLIGFLSEKTGLQPAQLTTINTVGSLVGCFAVFFCSRIVQKHGVRYVITGGLLLMSVAAYLWSICDSVPMYFVIAISQQVAVAAFSYSGNSALITRWYPRTKGTVMGITTTGILAASFTYIRFISIYVPKWGFSPVMQGTAATIFVLAVSTWFWVKDTPEEVGLLPDNKPYDETADDIVSGGAGGYWGIKQLLVENQGLIIVFLFGIATLVARAAAVSTIPLIMEMGFERVRAVDINSLISLSAIVGSIVIGILDTKLGTKKATIIFCVLYTATFFITYVTVDVNRTIALLSMGLGGFAVGANANLLASMIGSVYGRHHYPRAHQIIYPGINLLVTLSYLIVGQVLGLFGTYRPIRLILGVAMAIASILAFIVDDSYIPAPEGPAENDPITQ